MTWFIELQNRFNELRLFKTSTIYVLNWVDDLTSWQNQIRRRKELFNTITLYLFIMHVSFSSHISWFNEWQSLSKRTQFSTLQSWASWVQRNCLQRSWLKIENRNIVCIKYHQWRAEQRWCIIIKQYKHSLRVYLSITCWIEAIDSLLITLFQIYCFNDVKLSCSQQAIFFLREFCSFNTHNMIFLMSRT